ncbi:serpin family protein [Sorangium sp. So ce1389]|uniref:serpin family protein n=1 Tax=Sorangium sp. So ce1389 TaxID=3133336 RepID=UPI003F60F251
MRISCFLLPLLLAGCAPNTATTARPAAPPAPSTPAPVASSAGAAPDPATTPLATSAAPAPSGSGSQLALGAATEGADVPQPSPLSSEQARTLAANSNAFAMDLYARLRKQQGNLAVSPASISLALAMTWAGARGTTAAEMASVLHVSDDREQVLDSASRQLSDWNDRRRTEYTMRTANRLFGEQSYPFNPSFLGMTGKAFGAPLEPVDFLGAADASRARINAWVAKETNDRIKGLIPPDGVDDQTRLVLVNALYFRGSWGSAFPEQLTRPAPFFTSPQRAKDVPTMNQEASFQYAAVDGLRLLEMRYLGGDFAMTFVLPDAKGGLDALEQRLTSDRLASWIAAATPSTVRVSIPRFEIDAGEALSLRKHLIGLGMKLAFDPNQADFTGIASPSGLNPRLFVDDVFHKVFVKVDEKGTEAAAASGVTIRAISSSNTPPPEFRADHPFLFFLRDLRSGMIVFMGRVSDPTKA